MKNNPNPLFVDSTKLHGDSIATRIELKGLSAYEGEKVFIELLDNQGQYQKSELKVLGDGTLTVRLALRHQQEFQYQFVVMREEQVVVSSGILKGRASHVLVEMWSPQEGEFKSLMPPGFGESHRRTPLVTGPTENRSRGGGRRRQQGLLSGQLISSLVDKWGL